MHLKRDIDRYLAEGLPAASEQQLRQHLRLCAHCRGYYDDELRLRHGIDLAIDASTPVQTQMRRIHRALAALPTVSAQAPGRWWLGAHEADA